MSSSAVQLATTSSTTDHSNSPNKKAKIDHKSIKEEASPQSPGKGSPGKGDSPPSKATKVNASPSTKTKAAAASVKSDPDASPPVAAAAAAPSTPAASTTSTAAAAPPSSSPAKFPPAASTTTAAAASSSSPAESAPASASVSSPQPPPPPLPSPISTPTSASISLNPSTASITQNQITRHDVLLGRGGGTNKHAGNIAFRNLVCEHQPAYVQSRKRDKSTIARSIVAHIRGLNGRFLKMESGDGNGSGTIWVDVGDKRATEKTSQALREGLSGRVRDIVNQSGKGLKQLKSSGIVGKGKKGVIDLDNANLDDKIKVSAKKDAAATVTSTQGNDKSGAGGSGGDGSNGGDSEGKDEGTKSAAVEV